MRKREKLLPYLFIAPAIILILVFRFFPIIVSLSESFYSISFVAESGKVFVGLKNYHTIFTDPYFIKSIRNTVLFNLIVNPLQISIALGLAVLLNQKIKGVTIARSILLLPVAVSLNISSLIGGMALDQYGLINGILKSIGLPTYPFLLSPNMALGSIIGLASWIGCPFWMLFILAGLQNIPNEVLEAADIDGANKITRFFNITLPMIKRPLLFVLVSDTIANFLLFVPIYVLTSGGPQHSTSTIMYEAYRRGMIYGDLGTSSAMVNILLLIILLVICLEFYFLRSN